MQTNNPKVSLRRPSTRISQISTGLKKPLRRLSNQDIFKVGSGLPFSMTVAEI